MVIAALLPLGNASAWDVSYEGDVMPNSPTLGSFAWSAYMAPNGLSLSSSDGEFLHLVDTDTNLPFLFREDSMLPAGTSITMETRVKVLAASPLHDWSHALQMGANTPYGQVMVGFWPDRVCVRIPGETWAYYPVDLTQFHTFRIAMNATPQPEHYDLWMDGQHILTGGFWGQALYGVYFGAYGAGTAATSDSYWDYVRYSKEYLPVPEPSTLMALVGGLGALGLPMLRRRR